MAGNVGVDFKVKKLFFDRAAVTKQIGRRNAAALSKIGSFVRRGARSSLRRRKRVSPPGQPPSVHSNSDVATLKNIWFAYEPQRQSVVIGPLKLNLHSVTWDKSAGGRAISTGVVPGIMEHGGRVGIRKMRQPDGTWKRVPFGHRQKAERLVPVWKATAADKAAARGVVRMPMRNGKGTTNFYIIPNPPSVIVWVNVAARPFMGPALQRELSNPKLSGAWASTSTARAA